MYWFSQCPIISETFHMDFPTRRTPRVARQWMVSSPGNNVSVSIRHARQHQGFRLLVNAQIMTWYVNITSENFSFPCKSFWFATAEDRHGTQQKMYPKRIHLPPVHSFLYFLLICALYVVQNFERKILYSSFLSIEISTCCFLCTRLLADIGGNMGLFLGCSVLTVFEFVDLLIRICTTSLRRKDSTKMKSKDTHLWFIIRK